MSIVSKVKFSLEEEGLRYVITHAPNWVQSRLPDIVYPDGVYRAYNPYGELSRSDMITHCENNNQIWYYGSHDRFNIEPPTTGPTPEPFEKLIGVQESPKSFVCELCCVRLIGDRAIPRIKNGKFVSEEMGRNSMLKNRVLSTFGSLSTKEKFQEVSKPFRRGNENHYSEPLINLVPRHGSDHNNYVNYAHWTLEDLPRLRGYEEYSEQTGRKPQILLKKNPPSWMKDTLRLMGFSASDWTEWTGGSATVSRLIVPKLSYVHSAGSELQPSDRRWVSETMISNADSTKPTAERIFLSRQNQRRRKVSNFGEISRVLSEFDFEVVRLEEMSIDHQVRLVKNAEIIAGPSGAAFANMIFADDASIIEVKPHGNYDDLWYILAQENGLDYSFVHCAPEEGSPIRNPESMKLDPKNIEQTLKLIIKNKQ